MSVIVPSVWKEEINLALLEYTPQRVAFKRNNALFTPRVQIRKPDESLKIETYPSITWYNLMDLQNVDRTDNIPYIVNDPETGSAEEVYPPIPFDMYYQLDFWGKNWGDVDEMSKAWMQSLPAFSRGKFFNLPVVNSIGERETILCVQKDVLRRRDTLTDSEKILHSTITYSMQGYLGRTYNEQHVLINSVEANIRRE